jgi:hypothetical protein
LEISIIKQIEDDCEEKINDLVDELDDLVEVFTTSLIIYQKGILDIYEYSAKYASFFDSILDKLNKVSPKFIKMVENSLLNKPNDYRFIGKLILTNHTVFSNFTVIVFKKIMEPQDFDYVI